MKQVFDEFKKLPTIIQIVIVALILFGIYKAYLFMKIEKELIEEKTEIQVLEKQGISPTYSNHEYNKWADDLEDAMAGFGTDIDTVYGVYGRMKNNADIIALERAFGLRLSDSTDFWLGGWGMAPTDLSDWLKGDLSHAELQSLNDQLERQGISKSY